MELHNTNSNPAHQLAKLRHDYDQLKKKFEKSINQHKQREKELKESEQKFSVLFDKSVFPSTVTRLSDGVIYDINEAFEREFGYTKQEAIGKTSVELGINPNFEKRKRLREKIKEEGALRHQEVVLFSKSGEKACYESNSDKVSINGEEYLFNTVRNISAYKNAIRKQKESFDLIRIAGEKAKMGGWNVILSENRSYWSDEVAAIHEMPAGYAPLLEDAISFYAPEWRDKITEVFTKCAQQGISYDEELEILTSSGKRVWVRTIGEAVRNEEGKIYKVQGAFQNITKRKQAGQKLRESEARYRAIFEATGTATLIVGEDTTILMANNECFDMFGYDPSQLAGQKWTQFVAPESVELMMKNHRLRQKNPELAPSKYEVKLLNNKGETRDVIVHISMISETREIVVSMLDITERKKAEQHLFRISGIMKNAQEIAHLGSFEYVASDQSTIWSEEEFRIYGIEPGEFSPAYDEMLKNCIHPDDANLLHETFMQALKNEAVYELEHRIIRPDGSIRWVYDKAQPYFDEKGKLLRYVGTTLDITERKRAEEELRKSKVDLEEYFQNDISADYVVAPSGQILSCNKTFLNLFDFESQSEAKQFNVTKLYKNQHERQQLVHKVKQRHKIENQEVELVSKSGRTICAMLNVIGIFNEKNELEKIRGYIVDITHQKNTESKLKKSEEKYRRFFEDDLTGNYHVTLDGEILMCNDAFVKMLKYKNKEELYKVNTEELYFGTSDRENFISKLRENKKLHNSELTLKARDGSKVEVIENVFGLFDESGELTEFVGYMWDVTQSKRAEKQMLKLTHAVEQSPVSIIITDLQGKIEYVNPKLPEISGYKKEELIGKNPRILKSGETSKEVYKTLWEAISSGADWKGELYNKKKNGDFYWESVFISPIKNEKNEIINYVAIKEDITERKKVTEDLKLAKEKAEENALKLLESQKVARLGYFVFNIKENCWTSSVVMDEIFGIDNSYVKDFDGWLNIIHPNFRQEITDYFEHSLIVNKEYFDYEYKIINRKNNAILWVHGLGKFEYNELGEPLRVVGTIQDISESKKIMEELIKARNKAEQSDRLKSAFLANMSHEIRTPMNGILGFTDLLLNPNLNSAEKEQYIKIVHKSGQRMLSTVNDIVEISKIEAGVVSVHNENIDVNETVEELIHFFEPEARDKGIVLQLQQLLPNEKKHHYTDKNKLDSIFTNFIKNAIKYTERGTIKVGCRQKETEIEFYVEDTGIGIPKNRLEAIFERFIQADIEDAKVFEGSGLGLAISKSYAEMLGGKIRVESEEGIGSTFYFSLPVKQDGDDEANNAEQATINKLQGKPKDNGLKVLIAEDDETSFQFLSLLVEDFSKEIMEAKTGVQAVELCRNNVDFDIIFMDIRMPEMNGYEAIRLIREFNREVIIIAQTAYAFSSDRVKAIEIGCNDFITKPIQSEELKRIVKQYFNI